MPSLSHAAWVPGALQMTATLEAEEAAAQAALQAELAAQDGGVWVDGEELELAAPGSSGGGGGGGGSSSAAPLELQWDSEMASLEDALALASAEVRARGGGGGLRGPDAA